MRKNNMIILGGITLTVFPLLAYLIFYFFPFQGSFFELFQTKSSIWIELYMGLVFGIFAGTTAWDLINTKLLQPALHKYKQLISNLKLTIPIIVFVSLCAGIGEELFFRGVVQHYFGIGITAVIFVAIHGYLSPFDWRISFYGLYMTLLIAIIGWMSNTFGLTSAMTAHAVIDIILFWKLSK